MWTGLFRLGTWIHLMSTRSYLPILNGPIPKASATDTSEKGKKTPREFPSRDYLCLILEFRQGKTAKAVEQMDSRSQATLQSQQME